MQMTGTALQFFDQHESFLRFMYGLLYFSLGLSVFIHSRRFSRLILARSLPWLGGFGVLTAVYEWGKIYIAFSVEFRGQENFVIFQILHQLILALSLVSLFQFGIDLLRPFEARYRWVRLVPSFVFGLWLFGPFIIGFSLITDIHDWVSFVSGTAARFICIPASVVSVVGLIHQQRRQTKPMKIPHMDAMTRVAAGALAAYGFFGGVFGPKSFFKPGIFLTFDTFTEFVGIPPHVFLSIAGVILFISFTRLLEIFDIETDVMIRNMEEAQVVANERERMARDLHDGALQQVYASGLLAQSLKRYVKPENHEDADRLVNAINQAIDQLREFLPQQKSDVVTVDLTGALLPKIEEASQYIQVKTIWDIKYLPHLSIDQARHLTAFLNEAMSNVIRHSKSTEMEILVQYKENLLVIIVRDFGEGISPAAEQGYGLKNMRDRARLLGAELHIESERNLGTVVKLELSVKE